MTHREWLNGLPDEEFLDEIMIRIICCYMEHRVKPCNSFSDCDECRLTWLKEERVENE